MTKIISQFFDHLTAFRHDQRGAAAAEMGLLAVVLLVPMLSITDLGLYAYTTMQVQNAAAVGAEAAWSACHKTATMPATSNCAALAGAVSTAIASTSLSTGVTEASGSPYEGFYCVLNTGALQLVGSTGTVSSPPTAPTSTCDKLYPSTYSTATKAGDYVTVSVTYTYNSPFSLVSVASLLPSPITATTRSRLGSAP